MTAEEAERIRRLEAEVAYLRLLVWRLSVGGLAEQSPKYRPWLGTPHVQEMPRVPFKKETT